MERCHCRSLMHVVCQHHFPSKVAWYHYETTTSLSCQNSTCRTWHNLNWYCVKCTCFGISYSASVHSNASKAVRSSCTSRHTVLFCDISLHGMRTQSQIGIVGFCSSVLNFTCCLHIVGYDTVKLGSGLLQCHFK